MTGTPSTPAAVDPSIVAFLRDLTEHCPRFVVWKNLERSVRGLGDVDTLAPREDVDALTDRALRSAVGCLGAQHAIVCDHLSDVRLHFFVQPARLPELFELDVWMRPGRGSAPWAEPRRAASLSTIGAHGVRTLRPGAEAVMLLVYKGLSRTGADRLTDEARLSILHAVRDDDAGAREACAVLPPRTARASLRRLIDGLGDGEWRREAALRALVGFVAAGPAHPLFAARRAVHRLRFAVGRECSMFGLMRRCGREVPEGGVHALLDAAHRDGHSVWTLGPDRVPRLEGEGVPC